jgi:hypothetical protein
MAERPRINRGVRLRGESNCDQFIPDAIKISEAFQKFVGNRLKQEVLTQEKLAELAFILNKHFHYEIKISCKLLGELAGLPADYQVVSKRLLFTDVTGQDYIICIAADKTGEFLIVARQTE